MILYLTKATITCDIDMSNSEEQAKLAVAQQIKLAVKWNACRSALNCSKVRPIGRRSYSIDADRSNANVSASSQPLSIGDVEYIPPELKLVIFVPRHFRFSRLDRGLLRVAEYISGWFHQDMLAEALITLVVCRQKLWRAVQTRDRFGLGQSEHYGARSNCSPSGHRQSA
jgi:hypothetical protein